MTLGEYGRLWSGGIKAFGSACPPDSDWTASYRGAPVDVSGFLRAVGTSMDVKCVRLCYLIAEMHQRIILPIYWSDGDIAQTVVTL